MTRVIQVNEGSCDLYYGKPTVLICDNSTQKPNIIALSASRTSSCELLLRVGLLHVLKVQEYLMHYEWV